MIADAIQPEELVQAPETAKKLFAALISAVMSNCECEACKILRLSGTDLKKFLLR